MCFIRKESLVSGFIDAAANFYKIGCRLNGLVWLNR